MKRIVFTILMAGLFLSLMAQPPANGASINIFGVVLDEASGLPIIDAAIYFRNEMGKIIYEGKTNTSGYFNLTTKLSPGREILIELSKEGYRRFSRSYFIKDRDNGLELTLIPISPSSKRSVWSDYISGYIKRKNQGIAEPVEGVKIEFELNGKRYTPNQETDASGYFIIYHNFENGDAVTLYFEKDGYKSARTDHRYIASDQDRNSFNKISDVEVKKKPKLSTSLVCLVSGGGLGVGAGVLKLRSNNIHDNYLDFANFSNQDAWAEEYDKANKLNKTSGYLLIGGAAVLTSWGVYKLFFADKSTNQIGWHDAPSKAHYTLRPIITYNPIVKGVDLGINLSF